jgi:hypothetical protein
MEGVPWQEIKTTLLRGCISFELQLFGKGAIDAVAYNLNLIQTF